MSAILTQLRDDVGRVWRWAVGEKHSSPKVHHAGRRLVDFVRGKLRKPGRPLEPESIALKERTDAILRARGGSQRQALIAAGNELEMRAQDGMPLPYKELHARYKRARDHSVSA